MSGHVSILQFTERSYLPQNSIVYLADNYKKTVLGKLIVHRQVFNSILTTHEHYHDHIVTMPRSYMYLAMFWTSL